MLAGMNPKKAALRQIILDIIFKKEKVTYPAHDLVDLKHGVQEVLLRRAGKSQDYEFSRNLPDEDGMLVQEIFWDLFIEKYITLGFNTDNPGMTHFRLHSED